MPAAGVPAVEADPPVVDLALATCMEQIRSSVLRLLGRTEPVALEMEMAALREEVRRLREERDELRELLRQHQSERQNGTPLGRHAVN
jgi:hypothetical protein